MIAHEKIQALAESPPPLASRFLRPAPAAKYLSVSRATLYNLLNAGKLRSHLVGEAA